MSETCYELCYGLKIFFHQLHSVTLNVSIHKSQKLSSCNALNEQYQVNQGVSIIQHFNKERLQRADRLKIKEIEGKSEKIGF